MRRGDQQACGRITFTLLLTACRLSSILVFPTSLFPRVMIYYQLSSFEEQPPPTDSGTCITTINIPKRGRNCVPLPSQQLSVFPVTNIHYRFTSLLLGPAAHYRQCSSVHNKTEQVNPEHVFYYSLLVLFIGYTTDNFLCNAILAIRDQRLNKIRRWCGGCNLSGGVCHYFHQVKKNPIFSIPTVTQKWIFQNLVSISS
jgi:hypothetical protein